MSHDSASASASIEPLEGRRLLTVSWVQGPIHGLLVADKTASGLFASLPRVKSQISRSQLPANAPPIGGTWNTLFADNFQSESKLNPVWTKHMWWSTHATQGDGFEVDDPANVSLKKGTGVVFTATHNSAGYKSGLIQTGGVMGVPGPSFSYQYGFAAARIKFPVGQGLWPAFWMLPRATPAGTTDQDRLGEIDILDNGSGNPNALHAGVGRFGLNFSAGIDSPHPGPIINAGWHTIGVDWQPDHITFYVDGHAWASTADTNLIPTTPEYLILNLSAGGAWSNGDKRPLTSRTKLPAQMSVAWVKVWQKQPTG